MNAFEQTNWTDKDFAEIYLQKAEVLIPVRRRVASTLISFYEHWFGSRSGVALLDLGGGDGIFTEELLAIDSSIRATLVDGSEDMINKAKERLAKHKDVEFLEATFEELLSGDKKPVLEKFDLVFSALAIHHLPINKRGEFIDWIHAHMNKNAWFVNFDVCRSPSEELEQWYQSLWEERMVARKTELDMEVEHEVFMQKHRDREHGSRLIPLAGLLRELQDKNFEHVDCFYKHGLFAMYGGRK